MKTQHSDTIHGNVNPLPPGGKDSSTLLIIVLIVVLSLLNAVARAQCTDAPSLAFANPVLFSGTDGQVGAVYRFANVGTGIDAYIEILALSGGSLLGEIDNTTQGYFDAWQPYVTAGANDTSYLDWRISFKIAGTLTDTILPCLAVTAVDIDGDSEDLKEFVEAATPGAYAVDPFTTLTVTFNGVTNRAIGQVTTIPNIDTNRREAMFQMNFENVSSIIYRNGSISTKDDIDVRHTCIYFKSFFTTLVILPVQLLSFRASATGRSTVLHWSVTGETAMDYYDIQKSPDGVNWTTEGRIYALNREDMLNYQWADPVIAPGKTYYRLQLTEKNGGHSFSGIVHTLNNYAGAALIQCNSLVKNNDLTIRATATASDEYAIRLYSMQGKLVRSVRQSIQPGNNVFKMAVPETATGGMYILSVCNKKGELLFNTKILCR